MAHMSSSSAFGAGTEQLMLMQASSSASANRRFRRTLRSSIATTVDLCARPPWWVRASGTARCSSRSNFFALQGRCTNELVAWFPRMRRSWHNLCRFLANEDMAKSPPDFFSNFFSLYIAIGRRLRFLLLLRAPPPPPPCGLQQAVISTYCKLMNIDEHLAMRDEGRFWQLARSGEVVTWGFQRFGANIPPGAAEKLRGDVRLILSTDMLFSR